MGKAKVSPQRIKRAYKELWQQYEEMEGRFDEVLREQARLKKDLVKREEMISNLKAILAQRDEKLEAFKAKVFEFQKKVDSRKTEMELLERYMAEDRSAYGAALDTVAILKRDLEIAHEEVRLRDYWFSANKGLLEHITDILEQRRETIQRARLGPREFRVVERAPELEEALEELGLDETATERILDKLPGDVSEMMGLTENILSTDFDLETKDAILVRRALDRAAFGELEGTYIDPVETGEGPLAIAVKPSGDMEFGEGVATLLLEEPEEYRAGLDIGLFKLSKNFYNGMTRIMDVNSGTIDKVRMLLVRQGEEDSLVMDNREMFKDNNFLLGIYRGKTRGISLVPGLVEAETVEDLPVQLTEDSLYKDLVPRLKLDPDLAMKRLGMDDAKVATPELQSPHPYLGLVLNVAVSYLIQYPEMEIEVYDVVVPPEQGRIDIN
jgi:hypothetical protein